MMNKMPLLFAFIVFNANANTPAPTNLDDFKSCSADSCSIDVVSKYNTHPSVFGGDMVYSEPVYSTVNKLGDNLLFQPKGVVSVYNPVSGMALKKDTDYTVDGKLITINPSRFVQVAPENFTDPLIPDPRINFRLKEDYNQYQYPVTYEKNESLPLYISGDVNNLRKMISESDDLKVTFFGDSITFIDEYINKPSDFTQPPYAYLVNAYMAVMKGDGYKWYNPSVKGWNTNNAVSVINERFLKHDSDLYILAFGMNDAVDVTPETYLSNIETLIKAVKAKRPDAYILIESSTLPNPDWTLPHHEYFKIYENGISNLTNKYDKVVFLDLTSTWRDIFSRKNYWSMTMNGINHPNDFGHRVIAEALLTTLLGSSFK